jgi:hypothetical protein
MKLVVNNSMNKLRVVYKNNNYTIDNTLSIVHNLYTKDLLKRVN